MEILRAAAGLVVHFPRVSVAPSKRVFWTYESDPRDGDTVPGFSSRRICSQKGQRPAKDLLRRGLTFWISDFDPPIPHPAFIGAIVSDGLGFSVALGGQADGGNLVLCQPGHH